MKTIAFALIAVLLAIGTLGCSCTIEKKAVSDVEESQDLILPEYVRYVEADAALTKLLADKPTMTIQEAAPVLKMGKMPPERLDNRKKLVESLQRLTAKLKKSIE